MNPESYTSSVNPRRRSGVDNRHSKMHWSEDVSQSRREDKDKWSIHLISVVRFLSPTQWSPNRTRPDQTSSGRPSSIQQSWTGSRKTLITQHRDISQHWVSHRAIKLLSPTDRYRQTNTLKSFSRCFTQSDLQFVHSTKDNHYHDQPS